MLTVQTSPHVNEAARTEDNPRLITVLVSDSKVEQVAACWFNEIGLMNRANQESEQIQNTFDLIGSAQSLNYTENLNLICINTESGAEVGFLVMTIAQNYRMEIHLLCSHPNRNTSRGVRGAGTALIHAAETLAGSLGLSEASIVDPYFHAVPFYEQFGYEDENGFGVTLDKDLDQQWKKEDIPPRIPTLSLLDTVKFLPSTTINDYISEERQESKEGKAFLAAVEQVRIKSVSMLQIIGYLDHTGNYDAFYCIDVSDPDHINVAAEVDFSKEGASSKKITLFIKEPLNNSCFIIPSAFL